jgi:erythromycin esterase
MPLPPARRGSLEALLHDAVPDTSALSSSRTSRPAGWPTSGRTARSASTTTPVPSGGANFVPPVLGRRNDAFCWFDKSRALTPLHDVHPSGAEMETYFYAD